MCRPPAFAVEAGAFEFALRRYPSLCPPVFSVSSVLIFSPFSEGICFTPTFPHHHANQPQPAIAARSRIQNPPRPLQRIIAGRVPPPPGRPPPPPPPDEPLQRR